MKPEDFEARVLQRIEPKRLHRQFCTPTDRRAVGQDVDIRLGAFFRESEKAIEEAGKMGDGTLFAELQRNAKTLAGRYLDYRFGEDHDAQGIARAASALALKGGIDTWAIRPLEIVDQAVQSKVLKL